MGFGIYQRSDLAQSIEAALILGSQVYCNNGGSNISYLRGMFAMGEYQATQYGLHWPSILHNVREALDTDVLSVLDEALQLEVCVSAE